MAAGSLVIAVTPSYSTIGVVAPVALLLARLLQGLRWVVSTPPARPTFPRWRRPAGAGSIRASSTSRLVAGQLTALGVQIVLQQVLTQDQMYSWGWRIPFVIGATGAVVVMLLRRGMDESESFKAGAACDRRPAKAPGSLRLLLQYPRECLLVVGLTLGGTVAFYTYTTYMQKFMINTSGLSKTTVAWINFAALVVFVVLQPIAGALSDRIGRRKLLMFFGIGGTVLTVPIMTTLAHDDEPVRRVRPDDGSRWYRHRLHLDQLDREGRTVPDRRSGRSASGSRTH